jgi:hypothetical protein
MKIYALQSPKQLSELALHFDTGSAIDQSYAFRGHADASWPLQPTLLRHIKSAGLDEGTALKLELLALNSFREQAHHHITPNTLTTTTDTVSWWTLMQHHGAPTRLLDWTASIFVAAYFAVISEPKKDGAIIAAHVYTSRQGQVEQFDLPQHEQDIQEKFLLPGAPSSLIFVKRQSQSDRMIAQQGGFTVCRNIMADHGDIISAATQNQGEQDLFVKLVVPSGMKSTLLRQLCKAGRSFRNEVHFTAAT